MMPIRAHTHNRASLQTKASLCHKVKAGIHTLLPYTQAEAYYFTQQSLHCALTSTGEVLYAPFLPLEEVPTLPAAEVQHSGTRGEVGANQDTLHPVVEVTHVKDWALWA